MKRYCVIALMIMAGLGIPHAARAAETATAAQLAEAKKILHEVPLIDGHNDVPWQYRKRAMLTGGEMGSIAAFDLASDTSKLKPPMVTDIPRMRAGCMGGQFWSVYIPATITGSNAVRAVLEQIEIVHKMVKKYPDALELALTAADVERIHKEGKIASLIGMEGGHSINNSLDVLRQTYALGARYMTLTHTKNVEWADSANDEPKHHGLTPFGVDVVHEMNRLGMMVDLSHVSAETMQAALDVSKAPVIFSHSSARALCDNPRNVPDDILKQVPQNGGIVMVTFFPDYLTEAGNAHSKAEHAEQKRLEQLYPDDNEKRRAEMKKWVAAHPFLHGANIGDVADHIDHVRKVAGIDYIGVGGDYEGFDGPPDGLEDVSCYPALFAELLRRGYTEEDIKKVAGLNILRVMRHVEAVAAKMQGGK
jgi:membrane dipeptidase